jgi:hypothetical protein
MGCPDAANSPESLAKPPLKQPGQPYPVEATSFFLIVFLTATARKRASGRGN